RRGSVGGRVSARPHAGDRPRSGDRDAGDRRLRGEALHLAGSGSFAADVAEWARDDGWGGVGRVELLPDTRVGTVVAGLPVVASSAPPEIARAVVAAGGS